MKTLVVGVGAAGNKAVVNAIERGVVALEDTMIINSTAKDFPKNYNGKKIMLTTVSTGCGKERAIAKEYAKNAMQNGLFNFDGINEYLSVVLVTSTGGGAGAGATPIIAKLFQQVYARNTHIIAFTGFEDDVRELANTIEFFKEIDSSIIVQTVSNSSFLQAAGGNKLRAEEMANNEMAERISVLTGQDFIEGSQNIDDTDILKLSNTAGYMTIEKKYFNKSLETRDDFEKIVKNMIYNSATVKSVNPSAARLGVVLNINPASEDAIDFSFTSLKNAYGNPFELFTQVQWDGKKEYIAYIASGMKMPLDELVALYERYKAESEKINKNGDEFFLRMSELKGIEEDAQFDMIKDNKSGIGLADFLNNN